MVYKNGDKKSPNLSPQQWAEEHALYLLRKNNLPGISRLNIIRRPLFLRMNSYLNKKL